MATKIFPSVNDVGVSAGDGNIQTEDNLTAWRGESLLSRYRDGEQFGAGGVISGFDFSSGTATSITLTAGVAYLRGFRCEATSTISGALTANTFNYVFLALTKSGGLVTGIELAVRTAVTYDTALASIPDDSILLWVFETDGSSIIAQHDFRIPPSNAVVGVYVGDDAATRTIDIGFRPKKVTIQRFTAPRLVAHSGEPYPRDAGETNFGLYMYDPGASGGAGCAVGISANRELRPQLEENGFSIEDGPGDIAPGHTLYYTEASYDPPSISAGFVQTKVVTVTGAIVGDVALVGHANLMASLLTVQAQVTAADTVTIYIANNSTGLINASASDLFVTVIGKGGTGNGYKLNELNARYFFVAWY